MTLKGRDYALLEAGFLIAQNEPGAVLEARAIIERLCDLSLLEAAIAVEDFREGNEGNIT